MLDAWTQTYSGGVFHPLDPQIDEIRLADIASALSKMCRFGGHCIRFYSVAEHSVHIAELAPLHLKLTALMHDASEAYLSDVLRPIKPRLVGYHEMEEHLMEVLAKRFSFEWPLPTEVKHLDNCMLLTERQQNMAAPPKPWDTLGAAVPLDVGLKYWTPSEASYRFTTAFYRYGGRE